MSESLLATFWCDTMLLALPVQTVHEVLWDQHLEPVPKAPLGVVGLFSLRGRILAVTDVRARMGLPAHMGGEQALYVVQGPEGLDVLRVDGAGEVLGVNPDDAITVPDTTPVGIADLLAGAYQVDDALVLVVDLSRVLDAVGDWAAIPHVGTGH